MSMTAEVRLDLERLIAKWRKEAAEEQRVSFCADELEAILTDPDDGAQEPEPTDAEEEMVRRRCLDAARLVVHGLSSRIDQTLEREEVTILALKAMCAVYKAWSTIEIRGVDVDVAHVVATALWEQIVGLESVEDQQHTHPYAAAGVVLEGYSRAARLLEIYRMFEDNLDSDYDFGTATTYAEKVLAALGEPDGRSEDD